MNRCNGNIEYKDLNLKDLSNQHYDIAVFACGYENRCTLNYSLLVNLKADKQIIFEFKKTKSNRNQMKNKKIFKKDINGKEKYFHTIKESDGVDFTKTIFNLIENNGTGLSILIDYSSMPRNWYCTFLHRCNEIISKHNKLSIDFIYRSSSSENVSFPVIDSYHAAMNVYQYGNIDDEIPKLLLLGLGLDGNGAEALIDVIQAEVILFYTDPGFTKNISSIIIKNNKYLLSQYKNFKIPILNMKKSLDLLVEYYTNNRSKFSFLIAPVGPKPMILISTLLTILNPEISDIKVNTYIENLNNYFDHDREEISIFRVLFRRNAE